MDELLKGLAAEHDQVLFCHDRESGLTACVALHDTSSGLAMGGTRMRPYPNLAAAMRDVVKLSRAMSFKAACARLPIGGAKGAIIGQPGSMTEAKLRRYAKFVDQLGGLFVTGQDMNLTVRDVDFLRGHTAHIAGYDTRCAGPVSMTALGVFYGIKAAVKQRFGSDSVEGHRIAVQGVGQTGQELCRLLDMDGADLVVSDVDPAKTELMRARHAATVVPLDEIAGVDAEVFSPCAMGEALHRGVIQSMKAKVVAGSANNQLTDEEDDSFHLAERGILYCPDFVINGGGLIEVYHESRGYDLTAVTKKVRGIGQTLTDVFQKAQADQVTPLEATRRLFLQPLLAKRRLGVVSELAV